ncbi:Cyanovirin-N [Penicillium brevicompactum]|uniref:Cyanovirin-N n=1 Tax=Penicillium brevicompactum TaxID=5074 RepID=A0A9W9R3A8_PENBR|nr:Cyanovirin-N [Penicillium brevicompactum]
MINSLHSLLCILLSQIDIMSFHASASKIELEDDHILKATLRNEDGDEDDSTLDLNEIIGNDDGHFAWGGGGFKDSADEISFDLEGDEDVPILRAKLKDVDGEEHEADINLAERIGNDNGHLVFHE